MFSEAQYTDTEILIYSYFVDQKPAGEEEKTSPYPTHVYEENGVYYCASTTQNGVYWYVYVMNNPLRYIDPTGYMTQAEFESAVRYLLSDECPYGGSYSEGGGFNVYGSGGEAYNAGIGYQQQNGGGGSWQPVYSYSVRSSGKLGGFVRTGLYGGPKFRWQSGNFNINFSSEIIGWEWMSDGSEFDYSVGPWSNETLDEVYGTETDFSNPGISLTPLTPSLEGGHTEGGGNDALYLTGLGFSGAGFIAGGGEYSNAINGRWRGGNGKWYNNSWGGNQWTGARSNVINRASAFKLASRGFFYGGALISGYQGYNQLRVGDYNGALKSGLDIGMGAVATFGGPPGWIIGGGYFLLDAVGAFNISSMPAYVPPLYSLPDNTYVAPPIKIPYP